MADVVAVLDDLGIRSAAACGWSMGGETAPGLAALEPGRTQAIAVFGTNPASLGFADSASAEADTNDEIIELFQRQGMEWIARILLDEGRPEWAALLREADPLAMAARARGGSHPTALPTRLRDLNLPILAVWGEQDAPRIPSVWPAQATTIVIPNGDHLGPLTRTDVTIPALRSLLESVSPWR